MDGCQYEKYSRSADAKESRIFGDKTRDFKWLNTVSRQVLECWNTFFSVLKVFWIPQKVENTVYFQYFRIFKLRNHGLR